MESELFTVAQAAKYLQLSVKTVRGLISDGRLRASRVSNRSWRIKKTDIEAYLNVHTNQSEGDESDG
jgi:excisionase family DNA binding protein